MYAKRIYRKKAGPKRAYKKRTAKGVTMATKRYVKREIHRNIENKQENLVAHKTAVQPYNNLLRPWGRIIVSILS